MKGTIEIVGKPEDVKRYKEMRGVGKDNIDPSTGRTIVYGGLKRFGQTLDHTPVNPNLANPEYRLLSGSIKSFSKNKADTHNNQAVSGDERFYIEGIANANIVDRVDERLEPAGIDVVHYMKNNVLLADHLYFTDAAIGIVEELRPEDDGVHFKAWIGDPKEAPLTDRQKNIRSLIAQGILKTVSVGFIPKKIKAPTFNDEGNMIDPAIIENWEMLELSIVSIPANPGATFEMRQHALSLNTNKQSNNTDLTNNQKTENTKNIANVGKKQTEIVYENVDDVFALYLGNTKYTKADADKTTIQTLIFDKDDFTLEQAVAWAKEHEYAASKVDETEDSYRLRQRSPEDFEDDTFRTIDIDKGIKAVIGRLKERKDTDDMDEKTAQELITKISELITLQTDTNAKIQRLSEQSESILAHFDSKAKPEGNKEDDEEEDQKGKDPKKEDEDMDKDKEKSLSESIEKAMDEIKETLADHSEKIGKLSSIVEMLFEKAAKEEQE